MIDPEQPDWFNALSEQQKTDFCEKVRHPNMTDKGAITQAIEALELGLIELEGEYVEHEMTTDYDLAIHKQEQALKSLKAFKDGAPGGLKDNVENIIIRDEYVERINEDGKKDIMVFYKAGKHLQKGIE